MRRPHRQGGWSLQLGLDRPVLFRQGRRQRQLQDEDRLAGPRKDAAGRVVHQAMRRLQEENGKPLIDVLDVHWYPQGQVKGKGPYMGQGLNPELNALRMRSTPTCGTAATNRNRGSTTPIAIHPWPSFPASARWIEKHNPGMEICLGEYNFGGGDNVTGGLAQCDVFGILARESVDLAFIWYSPSGSQQWAWQLFRSYDGRGSGFGDKLLEARSDNPDLSVFAARRTADDAVTVAAVNQNLHGSCVLSLDVGAVKGNMRVWRFDQDTTESVREVAELARPVAGLIELELPPASASMIVIAPAAKAVAP